MTALFHGIKAMRALRDSKQLNRGNKPMAIASNVAPWTASTACTMRLSKVPRRWLAAPSPPRPRDGRLAASRDAIFLSQSGSAQAVRRRHSERAFGLGFRCFKVRRLTEFLRIGPPAEGDSSSSRSSWWAGRPLRGDSRILGSVRMSQHPD